jgi:hypothetical protein
VTDFFGTSFPDGSPGRLEFFGLVNGAMRTRIWKNDSPVACVDISQREFTEHWYAHPRFVVSEEVKELKAKLEDAEDEALEQAKLVGTWADRAENAEAQRDAFERQLRNIEDLNCFLVAGSVDADNRAKQAEAKLAEAEATIGRVKAAVAGLSCGCARAAVSDALGLTKPFVLPTEVPARIVAVKSSTGDEKELTLFTDGDTTWWADIEDWGPFWTRSQVMDQFTGHRLLDGDAA